MSTVESLQKQIDDLTGVVAGLQSGMGAKPKKEKKPRAPSTFNIYMKTAIPAIKSATPGITHSEAFTKAASEWKDKKETFVVPV